MNSARALGIALLLAALVAVLACAGVVSSALWPTNPGPARVTPSPHPAPPVWTPQPR